MKTRVLFLCTLLLTLSIVAAAKANTKDEAELKALVQQMGSAQMAFDVKQLDSLLTEDYIEISPLGEFDPREKVLGFYAPEMKPPGGKMPGSLDFSEYSIRVYGKTAVVIVKETFTLPPADGKPSSSRSLRVMFVCRREKTGWKAASAQYTGIRPKQPAVAPKPN
ncbi:MAG: nuclear transport factor 2 family protein [Acidobacteria bacterium]|nr:nuclear transport factor 2 family protein [Acidobacteriota bacterium]